MDTQQLPINIYIAPNSANNPDAIKALQKGIQEALEKFQGKSIVFLNIKNLHAGAVGKHHPPHHWEDRKLGPHRDRHHHGWHHKGRHGPGHFKGRHCHPRMGKWFYHSTEDQEIVHTGQCQIAEIPSHVEELQEKDRNSKSSEEWTMLDCRSSEEENDKNGEHEEELLERFDNMNVTKSV